MKYFKKHLKLELSKTKLIFLYSVFTLGFYNFSFWNAISVVEHDKSTLAILVLVALTLSLAVYYLFFWLFSFNRFVLKFILATCLILNSLASYFIATYNIYIDKHMIANVFATDANEAMDLFNISILFHLVFFGILPAILICLIKIKRRKFWINFYQSFLVGLALLLLAGGVFLSFGKEAITFGRVNENIFNKQVPYSYIDGTFSHFKKILKQKPQEIEVNLIHNHARKKGRVMVMVIGETARRENFSLYGYKRETNPNLNKQDLFIFQNTKACGTSTAISVPCIFSPLGQEGSGKVKYKSYIHYLKDLKNLKIVWYDNNFGGCYRNCDEVRNYKTQKFTDSKYCKDGECVDGVFLNYLDKEIEESSSDILIILHENGSHGPLYYKRYPREFAKFTPECKTNNPQECTREELVNSYDNTILYNDFVLSGVIDILKKHSNLESSMIYTSDHGENLGEYGIYLHGMPYGIAPRQQIDIPLILWMSDKAKNSYKLDCIKQKENIDHNHDNIINSMMGFFGINAKYYKKDKDLFYNCGK